MIKQLAIIPWPVLTVTAVAGAVLMVFWHLLGRISGRDKGVEQEMRLAAIDAPFNSRRVYALMSKTAVAADLSRVRGLTCGRIPVADGMYRVASPVGEVDDPTASTQQINLMVPAMPEAAPLPVARVQPWVVLNHQRPRKAVAR
jgi:hypothetical protein